MGFMSQRAGPLTSGMHDPSHQDRVDRAIQIMKVVGGSDDTQGPIAVVVSPSLEVWLAVHPDGVRLNAPMDQRSDRQYILLRRDGIWSYDNSISAYANYHPEWIEPVDKLLLDACRAIGLVIPPKN